MNRYNELKLQVLGLFASTQGEWLGASEAVAKLDFFPARSVWSYLKRLGIRLAGETFPRPRNFGVRHQRTRKVAPSLVAFAELTVASNQVEQEQLVLYSELFGVMASQRKVFAKKQQPEAVVLALQSEY